MTDKIVAVTRRFAPQSARSREWDFLYPAAGKPLRWYEMEELYRVLIIADPGAGKTFEAQTCARKMRERGKEAFFIRIEAINESFEQAFEVGTAEAFEAWLVSGEEAWFFLDSVDEAQLDTPRALEDAISLFGGRIHTALDRAHIVITSREDAWQALPDRTLIEKFLPHGEPPRQKDGDDLAGDSDPTIRIFRLVGLSDDQIALFAGYYGISDVPGFIGAIERSDLRNLADRPFDLKALIRVWLADHKLGPRFEVLHRLIDLQLAPLAASSANVRIDQARARAAVQLLAGTVLMTGKSLICLPDGLHSSDRIDPRTLLDGWREDEIDALLHCGVFDDVVYTSVRFRHREVRELLGAHWAQEMLVRPGQRARTTELFFRDSYGEQIIVPRTRPILPWLILLDEEIRAIALALAPAIASEGGDPSRLPLEVRKVMLADIVEQIVSGRE